MEHLRNFLIISWSLFFIFLLFQLIEYIKYKKWIKTLENKPIDENIKKILQKIPYYQKLPENLKKIIHFKIQLFLNEKKFYGVNLEITDEIKVTIAFFACLPTLSFKYFCYPNVKYIIVYPNTIILHKHQLQEVIANEDILIEGEATTDAVIIAWNDAKKEIESKRNVIIHEFAHEFDYLEGAMDGIPPIEKDKLPEFTKVMFKEYEKFKEKTLKGRFLGKYHLIDKYAATNRAEFFAVMSEYFFMAPEILKKHFPDIYKELKNFYKIDTYKLKVENENSNKHR